MAETAPTPDPAPAPDTFADLDALAAKDPAGRLWHSLDGNVWSYPACAFDPRANIRVPIENVSDARVRAALDCGAWVVAVVDNYATPIRILAVAKAAAPNVPFEPLQAAQLGTADAA